MKRLLGLLLIATLCISCSDDLDDNIQASSPGTVSDFIYRGLNFWSLYKADVPDLDNDRFSSQAERDEFLNQFESPEAAFQALLSPQDRFSILRSDFIELENALAGIRLSSGMRFSILADPNNSENLFGVVRFVINNSPAQAAGVQRGMLFTAINGTPLTTSSNLTAIFNQTSFTINLADYDGTSFTLNGNSIDLTQVELSINPVHTVRTFEIEGEQVGYLHYTGFTNEFDSQLNEAFGQFQAAGITDLILDLRYNGGGSIESSNDLSSMITGQFNDEIFITQRYNEDRNADFEVDRLFNSTISNGNAINSLGLTRVFVLTSGSTASASELILSALDPYIEVIQIGTNTSGKFEGSFLLYDAPAPNFSRGQANINHRYVMLPLVLRSVNAQGLTDYFDGFTPDIELAETFDNLGQLGMPGEPLFDIAIGEITGTKSTRTLNTTPDKVYFESDQKDPFYQRMLLE